MTTATTMKALNYIGPYQVRVEDVERPKLEHPDDVIVKVTTVSNQWTPLRKFWANRNRRLRYAALTCSKSLGKEREGRWAGTLKLTVPHSMYEGRTAAEPGITFGKIE